MRSFRAIALLFALDGAVFGSWAARIPDVSDRVGGGPTALGSALLCVSLGALVSMRLAGGWCLRHGAGRVAVASAALASLALVPPGLCGGLLTLGLALAVFGAATGAANVAANSLGVQLADRLQRPVMSTLHAGFSLGGLAGAVAGGLAARTLSVPVHFLVVAGAGLVVVALLGGALIRLDGPAATPAGPTGPAGSTAPAGPTGVPTALIVLLGAIAGCTAYAEGALSDWGGLHLREDLHATPAAAATGYAAFSLAMAGGRLAGTRWVIRFGDTRILVAGGVVAALGMALALLTSSMVVAVGGFVLVGLGLSNLFPLVIGRAGLLHGARGVALASTVGYSGLLGGPPAIGFLAARAGLPLALSSIPVLALVAALLSLAAAVELSGMVTVAAVLRARARARLTTTVAQARTAARHQAADVALLVPSPRASRPVPERAITAYPGLAFLEH